MKSKTPTHQEILKKYQENEADNHHTENVVLLAKHYGTKKKYEKAKEIQALHRKEGSLTLELASERNKLEKPLYKKMLVEVEEEKAVDVVVERIESSDNPKKTFFDELNNILKG